MTSFFELKLGIIRHKHNGTMLIESVKIFYVQWKCSRLCPGPELPPHRVMEPHWAHGWQPHQAPKIIISGMLIGLGSLKRPAWTPSPLSSKSASPSWDVKMYLTLGLNSLCSKIFGCCHGNFFKLPFQTESDGSSFGPSQAALRLRSQAFLLKEIL